MMVSSDSQTHLVSIFATTNGQVDEFIVCVCVLGGLDGFMLIKAIKNKSKRDGRKPL